MSLRNYLDRWESQDPGTVDSRTLSTTTDDDLTAGYSTNVCPEDLCNVFESVEEFDDVSRKPTMDGRPAGFIASRNSLDIEEGNLKCQSTLDLDDQVKTESFVPKVQAAKSSKSEPMEPKTHFRMWGHGKLWTLTALACAWLACACGIACRYSTSFVELKQPMTLGSGLYKPVARVGMIRMEVCYNETVSDLAGCQVIRMSPNEVKDPMFNISRSLLTLATCLGVALTLILTFTVAWESVNLRPIGFAFLTTYFFQSFSMLFFDSNLCHKHNCSMAKGGILCIVTSVLWVATIVAVAKMDSFKIRAIRARRREARRKRRRERRERRKLQELAMATNGSSKPSNGSPSSRTACTESPTCTSEK